MRRSSTTLWRVRLNKSAKSVTSRASSAPRAQPGEQQCGEQEHARDGGSAARRAFARIADHGLRGFCNLRFAGDLRPGWPIPLTAHFVWFGAALPWVNVLALRSAAERGGFDRVVLHHDEDLTANAHYRALARHPRRRAAPAEHRAGHRTLWPILGGAVSDFHGCPRRRFAPIRCDWRSLTARAASIPTSIRSRSGRCAICARKAEAFLRRGTHRVSGEGEAVAESWGTAAGGGPQRRARGARARATRAGLVFRTIERLLSQRRRTAP